MFKARFGASGEAQQWRWTSGLAEGRRLGCQACVQGDVVIDVPPESQVHRQIVRKRAEARAITLDPALRLHFVEVAEPDMHHPSGDLERLRAALAAQWGVEGAEAPLPVLQRLQKVLREGEWKVTVAVHTAHEGAVPRILDLWPGLRERPVWGAAVDLGSVQGVARHRGSPRQLGPRGCTNLLYEADQCTCTGHRTLTCTA